MKVCECFFFFFFHLCHKLPIALCCTHHDRCAGVGVCTFTFHHVKTCQMCVSQTSMLMTETPAQSLLLLRFLSKSEVNPLPLLWGLRAPLRLLKCSTLFTSFGTRSTGQFFCRQDVKTDVQSVQLLDLNLEISKIIFVTSLSGDCSDSLNLSVLLFYFTQKLLEVLWKKILDPISTLDWQMLHLMG